MNDPLSSAWFNVLLIVGPTLLFIILIHKYRRREKRIQAFERRVGPDKSPKTY